MVGAVSIPLLPNKAYEDGDQDDGIRLAQSGDRLRANNASGVSPVEADNGNLRGRALPTRLTFTSVYALMVGSIIGAGIFASPSRVDSSAPSPGVAIFIWLAAGLTAWAGAIAFAELGTAIPRNGGMQEYLRYIYGDSVASVMSRTWILASRPTGMAVLSIVFAEYWTTTIFPSSQSSEWVTKSLAMATVLCVLMMNCVSASLSTRFTNVLMISKLSTVTLILILALLVAAFGLNKDNEPNRDWNSRNWFTVRMKDVGGNRIDWTDISMWSLFGHLTAAMYSALWACSGFDSVRPGSSF
jgi:solute carrier family 7 (L-type amino acid transporter), member 9/15